MQPITITRHLDSETLVLPELRSFIGKTVEIRVTEANEDDDTIDWNYQAQCRAEAIADQEPVPTLEEVRDALAGISGTLTEDFRSERDE